MVCLMLVMIPRKPAMVSPLGLAQAGCALQVIPAQASSYYP